jgi:hypothetical protein
MVAAPTCSARALVCAKPLLILQTIWATFCSARGHSLGHPVRCCFYLTATHSLNDRLCRARRPPTDSREKASFGQQLAQHSRGACLSAVLLNVHLHCSRELVDAGSQGRTVRSAAMISPVSQGEWSDPRCRCREMPSILDRCGCLDRLGRLTAACECSDEGS